MGRIVVKFLWLGKTIASAIGIKYSQQDDVFYFGWTVRSIKVIIMSAFTCVVN